MGTPWKKAFFLYPDGQTAALYANPHWAWMQTDEFHDKNPGMEVTGRE
jgi:hypothetical protein